MTVLSSVILLSVNQSVIISASRDCFGPKKYFCAMNRQCRKVIFIIVVIHAICSTSVKTQKQKFGENKHWLEEITQGANVQKNR